MVCGAPSLDGLDGELRSLIDACHEESWRQADALPDGHGGSAVTDFRVRKSIRLLAESVGAEIEFDAIAREAGLSRPHFYKLFRTQTGVTPHLYVNTLLMEKALDRWWPPKRRSPTSASTSGSRRRADSRASLPPMSAWPQRTIGAPPRS